MLDFDNAEIAEPEAILSAFSQPGRVEFGALKSNDGSNVGHDATDQAATPVSSRSCYCMACHRWVHGKNPEVKTTSLISQQKVPCRLSCRSFAVELDESEMACIAEYAKYHPGGEEAKGREGR